MDRNDRKTGIDRRSMLKRTAAIGGLLAMPGSGVLRSAVGGRDSERVRSLGLLVPSGDRYRTLSRAVEHGAAEATRGTSVRIRAAEQIGRLRPAIDDMLHNERVDAILCVANTIEARELAEAADGARRPIHLIDSGVNPVDPRAYSPWLTISTLDFFGSNREIGRRAAERGMRRGLVLVTAAAAGCQTSEAIRQGFEEEGGEIARYIVVDRPELDGLDLEGVREAVAAEGPDVLFMIGERSITERCDRLVGSAAIVRDHNEDIVSGLRRLSTEAACALVGRAPLPTSVDKTDSRSTGSLAISSFSRIDGPVHSGVVRPYIG